MSSICALGLVLVGSIAVNSGHAAAQVTTPSQPQDIQDAQDGPQVNRDALILLDFQRRIDAYIKLQKDAAKGAPPLRETADAAKLQQAEQALAARIRALRADARPGDIFTPEIRTKFRQLMYPELQGKEGRDTKALMKEDEAPAAIPMKVNASYPQGAALPTVGPNLLAALPKLPEQLEYRIIGKHLILRDVNANLIVDFIPNAIR